MKIATSHPKIRIKGSFTKKESKFIKILEADKEEEKTLEVHRELAAIPKKGFDLNKNPDSYKVDWSLVFLAANIYAEHFISRYNLPNSWLKTSMNLLLFNVATTPDRSKFPPYKITKTKSQLTITINEGLSRRSLERVITKEKVSELLSELPKIREIKTENIETRKKMITMKKGHKGAVEIAGKLNKSKGEPFWYEDIPTYIKRFENTTQALVDSSWRTRMQILKKRLDSS